MHTRHFLDIFFNSFKVILTSSEFKFKATRGYSSPQRETFSMASLDEIGGFSRLWCTLLLLFILCTKGQ